MGRMWLGAQIKHIIIKKTYIVPTTKPIIPPILSVISYTQKYPHDILKAYNQFGKPTFLQQSVMTWHNIPSQNHSPLWHILSGINYNITVPRLIISPAGPYFTRIHARLSWLNLASLQQVIVIHMINVKRLTHYEKSKLTWHTTSTAATTTAFTTQ